MEGAGQIDAESALARGMAMSSSEDVDAVLPAADVAATDEVLPDESSGMLTGAAGSGVGYGATAGADLEKGLKDKKKQGKKAKDPQKAVSDQLKIDMASERTFFKWLWTGLHTGAIGTFIFITFDADTEDPMRLVVVTFAWAVAFLLVLYGLFAFYRRRQALRNGNMECVPSFTREHSPVIVVIALGLVIGSALFYAAVTSTRPHKGKAASAFGGG